MLSRKRLTVYLFIMAFLFNIGIGFTYLIHDEKNLSETVGNILTQPKMSTDHPEIIIIGDSELDAFCTGNGTSGNSWETAHVIENYEINGSVGGGISIINTTRFLIIQDCKITNSSSSGIIIDNCTNIKIQNCISESNSGRGVYILRSEGIFINSTDLIDNEEGLELQDTNNTEVLNSYFTQNYEDAIYIDSNCHNILFLENSVIDNNYGFYIFESSSISYIDNDIINNTGTGIYTELNSGDTFTGNVISNNDGIGLELYECNSTIVENNIVTNNTAHGLSMWGGDSGNYNIISNNTFSNNSLEGIYFDDSNHHNIIENNEICFNGNNGIYITDDQHNNTISFNNIANNANYGIWVERYSENSTILGNIIEDNGDNGIYIDQNCHNNTIKYNKIHGNPSGIEIYNNERNSIIGNEISFNDDFGININDCYYTSIFGNNISFNKYGIEYDNDSEFNQMWVNYISDNSEYQGLEQGTSNYWDNGAAGNYWGDYRDLYPGAISNGNIWDTNYTLNGTTNFNDTKPLVNVDPVLDLLPSQNLTYLVGETGHFISWMITDIYYWSSEYFIYQDDVLVKAGDWISGDAVGINVDGLEYGTYQFRIDAYDGTAWGTNENIIEVEVGAIPDIPVFNTTSQTINSTNITIQWVAVNFTVFYNIYINNSYAGNTTTTNFTLEFDFNGGYLIEITAQNEYGVSNRSLSIVIIVDDPNLEESNNNAFWYFFGGGWILVLGFIGVAFVKVKLKK